MVMKTRMIVFVIGIVTAVLGCATNEVQDDQLPVRVASYSAPSSAQDSGGYGAITVSPEQIFED
jgi:hypothetical protein